MKKEFNTKEEFLVDMLDYYTVDPINRRAFDRELEYCVYYPIEQSEGCAIGRCLPKELTMKMQGTIDYIIDNELCNLPEWMTNLGADFLQKVQELHDRKHNWKETGLSKKGIKNLRTIIKKFGLNPELFTKYLENKEL